MMRTHNKQPEARVEPERYIVKVDKIAQNQKIFCTGKNQNLWEFLKVDKENPNMPGNLYILLGDETLELTIKQVENMRYLKKKERIEIQIIFQEQTFDGS